MRHVNKKFHCRKIGIDKCGYVAYNGDNETTERGEQVYIQEVISTSDNQEQENAEAVMPAEIILNGFAKFPTVLEKNSKISTSSGINYKISTSTIRLEEGTSICEFQELDNTG